MAKKERTPEEEEKRKKQREEGQAFQRQREKIVGPLMTQGLSEKSARAEALRRISEQEQAGVPTGPAVGQAPPTAGEQITVEEAQRGRQEQAQLLEEQGAFEEFPIEQKQLVEPIFTEEGVSAKGLAQLNVAQQREAALTKLVGSKLEGRITPELEEVGGLQLAGARAQIDIAKSIFDFVDKSIFVARLITEAGTDVPVIGDALSAVFGSRSEKVQNIQSSLEAKNQMTTNIAIDVRDGIMKPIHGFRALNSMERQLDIDEADIQHESISSPSVRRSGELRDIQTDILELRQEINRARQEVAGIITQDIDPETLAVRLASRLDELKGELS